jgi:outer membrane protein, multidrug efflux system
MKKLGSLLCLLSLSACTMHPKYQRPEPPMATNWRIEADEAGDYSNVCWWKQFGDPVLDEMIDEALANNQELTSAIYTVEAFAAKLGIAISYLYPQLSGDAFGGRDKISVNQQPFTPGINPYFNSYTLLLNASYQADIWGQYRSGTEVAKANLLSQIETRRAVVLALVGSVASSYILLRQYDKQLVISNETIQDRRQAYDLAKTRFELGLTSEMEVQQALSELDYTEARAEQIKISIALTEDLLSVLMGRPPSTIKRGKILDEIDQPPAVPVALPSEVLNQRPDILAAEQNLIAANAQIGVAKAAFFPQISLTGAFGTESSELSNLLTKPSSVWSYGLGLVQEIFTGGYLTSNLKLARVDKEALIYKYESVVLNAFKEVNDALISHNITLTLADIEKERVGALSQYLTLSDYRYQEGLTDYLNFLDAERQLFDAELEYASVQGNVFLTLIDIYTSLGGGWVVNADEYSEKAFQEEHPKK